MADCGAPRCKRTSGARTEVMARAIVNAGGPWVKHVLDSVSAAPTTEQVRHVKGSHIVVPRVHPEEHAYILQNADKRIGFVIPYQDHYTLIGTTDVPVDEYERPAISEDEIDYLLELVNSYLATPLTRADVVWSYSGVRPLYDDGSSDPAAVTRDYVFKVDALDGEPGPGRAPVLSIFGGKITTYRKLAEAALAVLAPFFPGMKAGWTREAPLPGGDLPNGDRNALFALLCRQYPELPAELLRGLARRHGSRAMRVLDEAKTMADLGQDFGAGLTAREIDYLIAEEWAHSADDVLWRRTKCGLPMTPAQRDAVAAYCDRAARPTSTTMSTNIASVCLFCGSNVGTRPAYAEAATQFGRALAARGLTLIYGGGSVGLMDIAAQAALDAGGRVVGVITAQLMEREVGHSGLDELHVVATMHERKALMAKLSDAFVALPGGYGTFDELCEMATWDQLGIHAKPLVIVNLEGYFDGFLTQLDRAMADGLLKREHRALLGCATTVDAALALLASWQAPPVPEWLRAAAPRP